MIVGWIDEACAAGARLRLACKEVGIHPTTIQRWSTKAEEWAALDLLIGKLDLGVDATQIVPRESPDFVLVLLDGSAVGVELVELAHEGIARGMGTYAVLERDVRKRIQEAGMNVGVQLSTHTERIAQMRGNLWRPEAKAIFQLARDHFVAERGDRTYEGDELEAHGVQWTQSVSISASDDSWVGRGTHGPGRPLIAQVQRHLTKKNAKLAAYRANVGGPIWLLLVAGARLSSGTWSEMIRDRTFRSDFDRVFYVDHFDEAAFEVATTPC